MTIQNHTPALGRVCPTFAGLLRTTINAINDLMQVRILLPRPPSPVESIGFSRRGSDPVLSTGSDPVLRRKRRGHHPASPDDAGRAPDCGADRQATHPNSRRAKSSALVALQREEPLGTNYYLAPKPDCLSCGRPHERLHIGKSSAGWCFSLHVDPDNGISDLPDWIARWSEAGATIWNEYGEQISPDDMQKTITERTFGGKTSPDDSWFAINGAERGPNNLARHRVGGHCIGHGASTYDLIPGEFS